MYFFRPYPTIPYRIPNETKSVVVTDITRRFAISNFINNANVTFDEYIVQDGERPDVVAYDYYDDPSMDWLVLLTNEIQDPYFEWALSSDQFQSYIIKKYGSLQTAYQTVHHYEKIIQKDQVVNDGIVQRILKEKTLVVDYQTYLTLTNDERRIITAYDYEVDLNDQRKHIYLLDLHYLQLIKEEHPYIFSEGAYIR